MSQTVVNRAMFSSAATYTSGAPDDLTLVTGTLYRYAVGPKLTADVTADGRGWSADMRSVPITYNQWTVSGASRTRGMCGNWYYIYSLAQNGANPCFLTSTRQSNGNQIVRCLISQTASGNFWYNRSGQFTDQDSGVAIPLKQWFELRHSWENTSGNNLDYKLAYRLAGSTTWVTIYAATFAAAGLIDHALYGMPNTTGSAGTFRGRTGGHYLVSLTSISERNDALGGVDDPPNGPTNWYVKPSTGSDSNSGVLAAEPWSTITAFNDAGANCGFLPGDTVFIDNTGTPLDIGTGQLVIKTDNITVDFMNTGPKAYKDISGGVATWTQYDSVNYPRIWQTTDGAATDLTHIVLWEDDKPLTWRAGLAIVDVRTAMNANASGGGQFFCDNTTIYYVASDNSNPNTNGKAIHRSRQRGTFGDSAIYVQNCSGSVIRNLNWPYAKTTLARKDDGDAINAYAVQWADSLTGTHEIWDSIVGYGSKHVLGRTGTMSNVLIRRINVLYGPGSSYAGIGAVSIDVDFGSAGSGNSSYFERCRSYRNTGLAGSTEGAIVSIYDFYTTHAGTTNFMSGGITFDTCYFCSSISEQGVASGGTITLIRTQLTTFSLGLATLRRGPGPRGRGFPRRFHRNRGRL